MESHILVIFASCAAIYLVAGTLWRLYLCPIARFPGPRLAGLTFWYEFWYDVVRQGRYAWKIQELHERYGPIVRINPEELHVSDPSFYHDLYVGPTVRQTNKWYWSARMFGTPLSSVGTISHDLHRLRRGALNPFFSKKSISGLESRVQSHIDKLLSRFKDIRGSRSPVNLVNAFTALTADIISDTAFGEALSFLDEEEFRPDWHAFMMDLSRGTHLMKQFPWIYDVMTLLPQRLTSLLHPLTRKLFRLQDDIRGHVKNAQARSVEASRTEEASKSKDEEKGAPAKKARGNWCMLDDLATSSLPPQEKSTERLAEECLTLLGAGTVTTAWTLAVTVFHTLSNPSILERLRFELQTLSDRLSAEGRKPMWTDFEHCEYLSAVVSEGLRLSHGTSHRLARISPSQSLTLANQDIPAGTPVSMTQMFLHLDATIFPSPHAFIPERWIPSSSEPVEALQYRKKFLVPFSRGSRMCVGMNLAYAELYLTLGALFGPEEAGGQIRLSETEETDVQVQHDLFNPAPRLDSQGIRVFVE